MLFGLVAIVVGIVAWKFLASGQQFLPAFSGLVSGANLQHGLLTIFSGRSYLTGRFGGRDVAVRLQLRRGEYQLGYLVIAVRTGGPSTLDYNGIEAHTQDDAGKRALFAIATHDLLLRVDDGWLKTMWQPVGFVVFPGSFSEQKWRRVLEAMQTVATSLESTARTPGTAAAS